MVCSSFFALYRVSYFGFLEGHHSKVFALIPLIPRISDQVKNLWTDVLFMHKVG
jgi:hypothetical protein